MISILYANRHNWQACRSVFKCHFLYLLAGVCIKYRTTQLSVPDKYLPFNQSAPSCNIDHLNQIVLVGTQTQEEKSLTMNKIIIITGASRGIGASTAKSAAAQGYAVCVNYLKDHKAAETIVAEILSDGGKAIAVAADISKESDVVRMFETVDTELGTVTALVNNAGILQKQMRVDEMTAERLNRIFTVNITGYFLCAREAVRRMSTRFGGSGGAIVNVSSAASRLGSAGEYVDYAASKGATDTLTIGLSQEVASEKIRVNGVRPGFIYTGIHASGGEPGRVDRLKSAIPMQRGGQPEEVANAIMWLLSDAASYVTGAFIDAAGGR